MNIFRKNLKDECDKFNEEFPSMFEDMMNKNEISNINLKKNVKKVTFVPIKLKNDGIPHVILGKHLVGKRKDQYSFLGGGTGAGEWKDWIKKSYNERMTIVSNSLFSEVYEEFHIILSCDILRKCLFDVKRADTFLLFYVNIDNINYEEWNAVQAEINQCSNVARRYKEISEISDFPLEFIQNEYDRLKDPITGKFQFHVDNEELIVSRYVISMARQMIKVCEKLKNYKGVNFNDFKTISVIKIYEDQNYESNDKLMQ